MKYDKGTNYCYCEYEDSEVCLNCDVRGECYLREFVEDYNNRLYNKKNNLKMTILDYDVDLFTNWLEIKLGLD